MAIPVSLADIDCAYRLLLDRAPDPASLANYAREAREGRLTHKGLREALMRSPEFWDRQLYGRYITVDTGGGVVVVIDPEEPCFGRSISEHGTWEEHLAMVLARNLRPGDVMVDIGANVGIMSFRAARLTQSIGKVIAFEPDPANAACFLRGVSANRFSHVTLFPIALSDAPRLFGLDGGSNGYLTPANVSSVVIQAMRGDDLLAAEPRIDFIKLDIEGHEPQALAGLALTLARHRPMVLCEFNPRCLSDHIGAAPESFASQLFELTSEVVAIEHDGTETVCTSAPALIKHWMTCDEKATISGHLPGGIVHLDLLFRVM